MRRASLHSGNSIVAADAARHELPQSAALRSPQRRAGGVPRAQARERDLVAQLHRFDLRRGPPRTFVEAFRRIGEYRPGTEFGAWLFTIARYQLLAETTRLRRRADYHRRYAPVALAEELERRSAPAGAGEPPRVRHLRSCLDGMEPESRRVLSQRYAEGLPLEEIARRAGRSAGAVKQLLFQLRGKLHDCIARRMAGEAL